MVVFNNYIIRYCCKWESISMFYTNVTR